MRLVTETKRKPRKKIKLKKGMKPNFGRKNLPKRKKESLYENPEKRNLKCNFSVFKN